MSDEKTAEANPPLLSEELAGIYDNPEVFSDPSVPTVPKFRIVSNQPPHYPTILRIEITEDLLFALRENLFSQMRTLPGFEQGMIEDYGAKDWDEARSKIEDEDEDYRHGESEMYWFFIRNFPKLTIKLYDITIRAAVVYALRSFMDDPKERTKSDKEVRQGLSKAVRDLQSEISRMLGTRRRGGSEGKLDRATRLSFHAWYDEIHTLTKSIKKHYETVFKEFDETHRSRGFTFEQWQEFWTAHAQQMYGYEKLFVDLFAEAGGQSASDVAYSWMAMKTGYTVKYVKRLVMESRKKVTIKRAE